MNLTAILVVATVTVFAFSIGEAIADPLSKIIKFFLGAIILVIGAPIFICCMIFMAPFNWLDRWDDRKRAEKLAKLEK